MSSFSWKIGTITLSLNHFSGIFSCSKIFWSRSSNTSTPSSPKLFQTSTKKCVWPGFQKHVGMLAKAWLHMAEVHRHTTTPVGQFTAASRSHAAGSLVLMFRQNSRPTEGHSSLQIIVVSIVSTALIISFSIGVIICIRTI